MLTITATQNEKVAFATKKPVKAKTTSLGMGKIIPSKNIAKKTKKYPPEAIKLVIYWTMIPVTGIKLYEGRPPKGSGSSFGRRSALTQLYS